MKTKIISLLATVLFAANTLAQNTSTTKVQTDDGFSSQGIRVSFIKPTLEVKGKV